jgi:hypothetical protein
MNVKQVIITFSKTIKCKFHGHDFIAIDKKGYASDRICLECNYLDIVW